jgi:hypothetical protein
VAVQCVRTEFVDRTLFGGRVLPRTETSIRANYGLIFHHQEFVFGGELKD